MLQKFSRKVVFENLDVDQNYKFTFKYAKGQLNSEWIYEIIVSPKMPTKNFKDFCPGSLLLQG